MNNRDAVIKNLLEVEIGMSNCCRAMIKSKDVEIAAGSTQMLKAILQVHNIIDAIVNDVSK